MTVPKTRKSSRKFPYNLMKGSLLEAKDVYNTWYPVKVLSVKDEKVHVHFCNWSSRYDTWYPLTSNCLRPLMLTNSRDSKDPKASLCAPRMDRKHRDTPQYDLGAYVMAVWRNDYEYLAEVLAHRQRQGDRLEYRLRYIWDNVIEWTPASKLRKASQYEIDFVLQFCKQHGSTHSERLTSSGSNLHSPKTDSTGSPKNSPALTTRSNVKQAEPPGATSNNIKSNNSNTKVPKPSGEPKLETSFDQNDMVYDKAVLQFHEACRKRRELKRQAAMAANNLDSSVSAKSNVYPTNTAPTHLDASKMSVNNSGSRKRKMSNDISDCCSVGMNHSPSRLTNSPNGDVKPPHQAKRRHELPTSTSVSETPTSIKPSSVLASPQNIDAQCSSAVDKERPGSLVLRISKQQCIPPKPRNSLVVTVSGSTVPDPPKTDIPESDKPSLTAVAEPSSVTVAPIVYPCPYCPRRLRRAKLLNAHIANYHKTEEETTASRKAVSDCADSSRQIQFSRGNRSPQKSHHPSSLNNDRLSSADPEIPRHLLSCYRCGAWRSVSSSETESLLQCQSCLCWVHKTCYWPPTDDGVPPGFHCCDGCLRTSERMRPSRRNECHLSQKTPGMHHCQDKTDSQSSQRLISDATELLDWTHRLAPLLKTGWTLLNKTKLPSPTAPKVPPAVIDRPDKKQSISSSALLDGLSGFDTGRESPVTRLVDNPVPLEACGNGVAGGQSTTERTDGFFMEFENTPSMEPIVPFPAAANSTAILPTSSTATRLPLSTVASSVEPSYWRVIEEVDGDEEEETIVPDSNDALTGFLQDLGPNVLPDLDGMVEYLSTPNGIDPSCPRPTAILNGQGDADEDDLLSGVDQPHVASILDTPIKEALRSANLLAPVPVTLVSSVLQTTDSESKCVAIFQHSTTTDSHSLSTRSPRGQTEFLGDDGLQPAQDAVTLASSEAAAGEPFSTSTDLLAIAPFRDSLDEAVPLHSLATSVSCSEKALIDDDTCYTSQPELPTSSDCDHSLMVNLPVSAIDWISAPVASVCTTNSTVSMGNRTSVDCISSGASLLSVPGEPVVAGRKQATEPTSCLVTDDVHEQFEFLPIESRGCPGTTVRHEEDQEEEDYLDHRWVLANHKVNQNLDQLDQLILGPLERAITVVEAQLEQISTQLFVSKAEEGSSDNHLS